MVLRDFPNKHLCGINLPNEKRKEKKEYTVPPPFKTRKDFLKTLGALEICITWKVYRYEKKILMFSLCST